MKDKKSAILDYIIDHCKIIFPVVLIVLVAVTVVFALGARNNTDDGPQELSGVPVAEDGGEENSPSVVLENVPLLLNEDGELYTLITAYYNAMALGDSETLLSIYDEISENSILKIEETAKYIDSYSTLEIYTKAGMEDGSTVVCVFYRLLFVNHEEEFPGYETLYVCTNEQGELYIKNEGKFTDKEKEYITAVTMQDDVVEFNNRVNTEYNDLIRENPELIRYLAELDNQISVAVGERVAQNEATQSDAQAPGDSQSPEVEGDGNQPPAEGNTEPAGPQFATATTTVNVRSSDSEQADRLGKVTGGTTVQVQEVRLNGWTKIVYEGKDGYIKSEYLQMQENAAGAETIGTVTATTNINVRASASQTADRLGVLAGGESVDLVENMDGWCKIKYNGQIGYVKSEYVQQ